MILGSKGRVDDILMVNTSVEVFATVSNYNS
jgi:hypothetical protein